MSQLVNAEVNSGNSSTSNYTLQLRIHECHAGMKWPESYKTLLALCGSRKYPYDPPPPPIPQMFYRLRPSTPPPGISIAEGLWIPPAKFLFHLNRRPLQIYHENTAMSKLHIEYTMLDLNLSSRIWRTLKTQSKNWLQRKLLCQLVDLLTVLVSVDSRFCTVLEWNDSRKKTSFC